MKRHQAEKEMEEREEADMLRKKEESDRLFMLYQQEKDRQRKQNAQANSQAHLKQAVKILKIRFSFLSIFFHQFCSKNVKIVNENEKPMNSKKFNWINIPTKSKNNSIKITQDVSSDIWVKTVEILIQ